MARYDPTLFCVITRTQELALAQAEQADREIRAGRYRGPLHGVPYGIKDLFATRGIRTTWGAKPFENQVFDYDATAAVERLRDAGAVLIAKLSSGELAIDDIWSPAHPEHGRRPFSGRKLPPDAGVGRSRGHEALSSAS